MLTPDPTVAEFTSLDAEHTRRTGRRLGEHLQPGDVICLSGDLGAGKTVFAKGIGEGWGAQETVTSPTFTLIHEHHRAADTVALYHVDCYRLRGAVDVWGIGLEDMLHGDGVLVLEWPENVQDVLPDDRLWIALEFLDDTRRYITLKATGSRSRLLLSFLHDAVSQP